MFIIFLLIILIIIYIWNKKINTLCHQENFYTCPCKSRKLKKFKKYPYNPPISTPQTNYNQIISNINANATYKKDLSVALVPTPTIHCPELDNLEDCNKYGCNWFGSSDKKNSNSFCSSTYPTQF